MNKRLFIPFMLFILALSLSNCTNHKSSIHSPDGHILVKFDLTKAGEPIYSVYYKNKLVIKDSKLGFNLLQADDLKNNFKIDGTYTHSFDESWEMPWGEKQEVRNQYNQLVIALEEKSGKERKIKLCFKAYNDGIGFRYHFPEQDHMDEVLIAEELTEFNLTDNHTCWWIPGDWDIYEHLYRTTTFKDIDATKYRDNDNLAQTSIPNNAVNTPVTMRTKEGLHLSFHEANLTDYAGMTLQVFPEELKMRSTLVGSENTKHKVKRTVPFNTPWRTIQIAENAGGLIESDLIVNLNEPNKLGDVSWFTPMKYAGIWWDMHVGTRSWDKDNPNSNHGATTEYAKEMIDFAAANNLGGILVEGWNTGWEHWIGFEDREGVFDFVTPYPDYDLEEVVRYGKEKGVELIMHHETSAAPRTYEQQLDTAYKLMKSLGIHSVKTGYVGKIIPKGEYHHGQWMVNHYRKVLETGAKYQVAINAHEPIKATGLRRTYPNAIAREGLRGQEFNAWASDGGNPPEHLPIVAFTRMLAGPIDFTPGIFNIKLEPHKPNNQVNTTIAQQLALYVVLNSPIQMVPDLIENYQGHPALEFIRQVGVNWQETKVLNGEVGDFVTIARKERKTDNWFVGGITDENARETTIDFNFLDSDEQYIATIYQDGEEAHWDNNPTSYKIDQKKMKRGDSLTIPLAAGGGFAISLIKE